MQMNNSTEAGMERLSMQLDQMESWKIAKFAILTVVRLFSISSCFAMAHFVVKYRPIKNRVNMLLLNLCVLISITFIFSNIYQFFLWKNTILPQSIHEILNFLYYTLHISLITSITILPLFWFLFLTLRTVFQKLDLLILVGLFPPYLIPIVFTVILLYPKNYNIDKLYYYFILYYCFCLISTFSIFIYFMMLKLEERLRKNKLDYLLYLGLSLLVCLFPEVLCFTFQLYFFDERGILYFEIYYIDFSVDFIKSISPLVAFTWLTISNKYFRKACRKIFSKKNLKRIFLKEKKADIQGGQYVDDDDRISIGQLDLNEVFL